MYKITAALSLLALTANAADLSDSARLQKLEQAVAELQKENASLKEELNGNTAPAATVSAPALSGRINLSDSITELRLYGEGRLRYFVNDAEAGGLDHGDHATRDRLRYRLRLGADIKLQDHWFLGVQVEGNNSARSANVTLGENPTFAKATVGKGNITTVGPTVGGVAGATTQNSVVNTVNFGDAVFFSRAFLKYDPVEWMSLEGGKIPNPFVTTRMVWDIDINPEGLAEQFRWTFGAPEPSKGDGKTEVAAPGRSLLLFANFGQFVYDDVGFEDSFNTGNGPFTQIPSRADRWMLGWQIGARANLQDNAYFQVAPAFFNYTGGGLTSGGRFNGDSPLVVQNKSAVPALITYNQTATNDLAFIEVPVEFGWKMWNTPFTIFGDLAYNVEGSSRAENAGHPDKKGQSLAYQVGASVGHTGKKGDFELKGWWQHSEAYSVDPNIVDDDIFDGRLNMEGFFLQASYNLTNAASIILQYSHSERIDKSIGTPGFGALGTPAGFPLDQANLLYVDLNLKF